MSPGGTVSASRPITADRTPCTVHPPTPDARSPASIAALVVGNRRKDAHPAPGLAHPHELDTAAMNEASMMRSSRHIDHVNCDAQGISVG